MDLTNTRSSKVKAILQKLYGNSDTLFVGEAPRPTLKKGEVLVQVKTTSVNAGDLYLMQGKPWPLRFMAGLFRPTLIIGNDIAGVIVEIGEEVENFHVGDEVLGDVSGTSFGAYAEFARVKQEHIVLKPRNASWEQAGILGCAGGTAMKGLEQVENLKEGTRVLVNGASGGVGSYAVLIAKAKGCEVTAVCSEKKIEAVRSLGPDHIISYEAVNFWENSLQYDVIFDAAGYNPLSKMADSLTPKTGTFVFAGGSFSNLMKVGLFGWLYKKGRKFISFFSGPEANPLQALADLLEQGKIQNHIHGLYDFTDIPTAMRALEEREVVGKICIRFEEK